MSSGKNLRLRHAGQRLRALCIFRVRHNHKSRHWTQQRSCHVRHAQGGFSDCNHRWRPVKFRQRSAHRLRGIGGGNTRVKRRASLGVEGMNHSGHFL